MKKYIIGLVLIGLCASPAMGAWSHVLDGTVVPTSNDDPWWRDNSGGSINASGGSLNLSAGSGYCDQGAWFGPGTAPWGSQPAVTDLVVAGRFRIPNIGSTTGQAAIMSLTNTGSGVGNKSVSLGMFILNNGALILYDQKANSVITPNFGSRDLTQWHHLYMHVEPNGDWEVYLKGLGAAVQRSGNITPTNGEDIGYANWSAGAGWRNGRRIDISYDWAAYGDGSMMIPEPATLLLLALGLVPMLRRRR